MKTNACRSYSVLFTKMSLRSTFCEMHVFIRRVTDA